MVSIPIAKRVERLRLRKNEIAKATNLHENTVNRALSIEPKIQAATQRRIDDAVTAEELSLRDYLLALHPLHTAAAQ